MSDDLIRRSDAIEAITNHCENECYYRADSWCPQCQREEFQDAIKAIPSADRPQDDDFKNFDRESLILLIECQKERIGELLADRQQGEKCNE